MDPALLQPPRRFRAIDLLRFGAALAVVLYHYTFAGYHMLHASPVRYPGLEPVTKYGYLGVQLFFVISGYVVVQSAYSKTVEQFLLSRVTRLYPAFWVACTTTFIVIHYFGPPATSPYWSEMMRVSGQEYVLNLTMLQKFFGVSDLDSTYWTLTKEITFYFLLSLLLAFRLLPHLDIVLLLWLGYTATVGVTPQQNAFYWLFVPDCSPYFCAGMLFFLLQQRLFAAWKLQGLLLAAFVLGLRGTRAETITYAAIAHQPFSILVACGLLGSIFLVFWLISRGRLDFSRFAWLTRLGALTYPLYLLHDAIGLVLYQRLAGAAGPYTLLLGIVLTMLLAAYALHMLLERKASNLLAQWLNRLLTRPVG